MSNKQVNSTTVFKADITDFKAAMQEAARQIRLANSEFKEATAGMDKWSNSADGLEAKIKQLNSVLEAQRRQLDVLETEYEQVAKEQGENSKGAEELAIKINNQKAAIKNTEAQLDSYGKELNDVEKNTKDVEDATKKASDGFTVMKGIVANLAADALRRLGQGLKDVAVATFEAGASFEAGMSKVEAISGASAKEMELLNKKAKEMGETTKFSASESADAFNYMAMAGWKAEDMLEGIEGIMALAAASGSDLGMASDIVTDALTAFKMEAKDAGRFSDVLAAAAANANTNVEMMGESFRYIAPVAGALGYSAEDTAIALGLMANSGIKASTAGTSLRSMLTNLAKPTDQVQLAMDELGLSLYDDQGKMYSFMEIMQQLRNGMVDIIIPEEELTKGLEELADQLEAGEITQKEYDSSVKRLMERAYGASGALKAQAAATIAGTRGMSGLLAIINSSDEDFEKLTEAIYGSEGAAAAMAETMMDNVPGAITLLKSKIEGIMIKVFERASSSIRKGLQDISVALDRVDWDKFADKVASVAEKIGSFFSYVIRNGDNIVTILKTIAGAFVAYKAVSMITNIVTAFGGLITAVKAGESAVTAFNSVLSLNPWALVAAGVAAATVALVKYHQSTIDAAVQEVALTDEQKKLVDQINNTYDAYINVANARYNALLDVNSEYDYIKDLVDEYNGLVDIQGNIKKGYEGRASFIEQELAKALGVEVEQIQGLKDEYGKLGEAVDKLIEKKRAEAALNASQDSYQQAIKGRSQALDDWREAIKLADETEKKYKETQEEVNEVMAKYNRYKMASSEAADMLLIANQKVIAKNEEAKKSWETAKEAVSNAEQTYIGYNTTIQNYEGLAESIITGDTEQMSRALDQLVYSFQTAETGTKQSLEQQLKNYTKHYQNLQQALKDGAPGVTKQMVDDAKTMVDKADAELKKFTGLAAEDGTAGGRAFGDSIGKQINYVNGTAEKMGNEAAISAARKNYLFGQGGKGAADYFAGGLKSKEEFVKSAGEDLGNKALAGTKTADSWGSGSNFATGFRDGIKNWIKDAWSWGSGLARAALNGLKDTQQERSPSKITRQSGEYFGDGYTLGIASTVKDAIAAATELAASALDALGGDDFEGKGKEDGEAYASGLSSTLQNIKALTVESLTDLASPLDEIKLAGDVARVATEEIRQNQVGFAGGQVAGQQAGDGTVGQTVIFNQNITSPKAVDRLSIYRDTNSLLFAATN